MARILPAALALLALSAFGCGASGGGPVDARVTLLVADPPAAAEAGAYLAVARGYDSNEGLRLDIEPRSTRSALDRDEAAIVPASALAGDRDAVAVMAITQGSGRLLLAVPRALVSDQRPEVAALIRALQRGYVEALADPESAVAAMTDAVDGLDRARVSAELDRIAPSFTAGARGFGALDEGALRRRGVSADGSLVGPVSRD